MSSSQEIPDTSSQTSDSVQLHSTEYLSNKSLLEPQPFQSSIPLLGPLVVWFREAWNSVSTRWYLEPLIRQQSEFNHLLVQELHALNQGVLTLGSRVKGLSTDLQRLQGDLQSVRNEVQSTSSVLSGNVHALRNDLSLLEHGTQALTHHVNELTQHVNELTASQNLLTQHVDEVSDRLIVGDQELATLVHDVGELTYSIIGLNARLVASVESLDNFPSQQ